LKPVAVNIPSLTPLRGIAATIVAVFHFQIFILRFLSKMQVYVFEKGYLMVDLFFIMSGFIILHVYQNEFSQKITFKGFKKFIVGRFARIYPLHFLTLFLLVALFFIKHFEPGGFYSPKTIIHHVFLLQSFPLNNDLTWNIPSWSISAEWWAYLLFPFLCWVLFKYKRFGFYVIASGTILLYISLLFFLPVNNSAAAEIPQRYNLNIAFDYGFVRGIAGFMTGMLLYKVYQSHWVKKFFNSDFLGIPYLLLVLFAFYKNIPDIFFIPAFSLLILFLSCNTGKLAAAFNNRVLHFMGDVSYSIYMVHFLFIIFLQMLSYSLGYGYQTVNALTSFECIYFTALYILAVIGLSAISYYLVEKPARKFIHKKFLLN
jgi:peptidoglycan/LPS O-acetylase OafA/YrhL